VKHVGRVTYLLTGLDTEIDIYKTILDIRQQRAGFVQTDLQYKFIYLALKCYVQQTKLKPAEQIVSLFTNADDSHGRNQRTRMPTYFRYSFWRRFGSHQGRMCGTRKCGRDHRFITNHILVKIVYFLQTSKAEI